MGFKQFILTEGRGKAIDEYEAAELFKKNCKQYKWGEQTFYRGVEGRLLQPYFIDPSKSERKSANTSNFYTLWIDNSKKWADYPKRSKSLICTTQAQTAAGYGTSYMMIPYDGAKIGVCPSYDMWESFPNAMSDVGLYTLNEFNDYIWNITTTLTQQEMGRKALGKD